MISFLISPSCFTPRADQRSRLRTFSLVLAQISDCIPMLSRAYIVIFPKQCAALLAAFWILASGGATSWGEIFDDQAVLQNEVTPLLEQFCSGCHREDRAKGGVNLRKYPDLASIRSDLKTWERVIDNLETEEMPPKGEATPTAEVRQSLVRTLQALVSKVDCTIPNPGRVTLRRLNRIEYSNTVRDLLGVDIRPADDFPLDDVGYGFDTIGDVLSLPPLLMEKYLAAAERLVDRAFVAPKSASGVIRSWTARELQGDAKDVSDAPGGLRMGSNGQLGVRFDFPAKGKYVLRVKAYGEQAGAEAAKMAIRLDGSVLRTVDVAATVSQPGEYETEIAIARPGTRTIAIQFLNDFFRPGEGAGATIDRNLVVSTIELIRAETGWLWPVDSFDSRKLTGGSEAGQVRALSSSGEISASIQANADGNYQIDFVAYGTQAGGEPVRAALQVDGKQVHIFDIPAVEAMPGVYSYRVVLKHGKHIISLAFLNDYYRPDDPDPAKRGDRNFFVKSLAVSGSAPASLPDSHQRLIIRQPKNDADWKSAARDCLGPLLYKAYRRPVRMEEVERFVNLVEMVHEDGESFERGIKLAVEAMLVNPQFLYHVELDRKRKSEGVENGLVRPLNEWELASRLSYFLWSTMPDDELMRMARDKRLQDDAVLVAQVRRMLADPKSRSLVENFAGQWLYLRLLKNVSPDKERFPAFSEQLRGDMLRETESFLESVIKEDRSILDLIDSDDVFVNERLAKHYGIDGVEGDQFRRVMLPGGHVRGGLLTQASLLTLTSNPTRTSPVKRGKFLLEQVLGTPPPPPPPNVPELDGDKKGPLQGTLRQRMEQHRSNPSCASCHAKLDPLGFGFENFNAIGAWRDQDGESPVDASGVLPGGTQFNGVQGLKQFLLQERSEQFTRTLAEKLLIYGLGRGLEPSDRCAVDTIVESVGKDSYRFSTLITEIIKSDPFRKRSRDEKEPQ